MHGLERATNQIYIKLPGKKHGTDSYTIIRPGKSYERKFRNFRNSGKYRGRGEIFLMGLQSNAKLKVLRERRMKQLEG